MSLKPIAPMPLTQCDLVTNTFDEVNRLAYQIAASTQAHFRTLGSDVPDGLSGMLKELIRLSERWAGSKA